MSYAALAEKTHLLVTHLPQEIRRSLEVPAEANAAGKNASSDSQGTLDVHQKVGIKKRHLINSVTADELSQFIDYAVRAVAIEAALIENHVRAVVACIRTTHAAGIAKLAGS